MLHFVPRKCCYIFDNCCYIFDNCIWQAMEFICNRKTVTGTGTKGLELPRSGFIPLAGAVWSCRGLDLEEEGGVKAYCLG